MSVVTEEVSSSEAEAEAEGVRRRRWHGAQLAGLGLVGLWAAFALTTDRIRLAEDPAFTPGCDLNPVLSCGSVMITDQAAVLGFPNPLLGLVAFPVVVTLGVVQLSGTRPVALLERGLAVGALAGWAFVHWLAFQSLYRIGALCPWCLVVWAVVAPIAVWSVLRPWRESGSALAARLWSLRWSIVMVWYLLVVVLALVQFWSYWRTLL